MQAECPHCWTLNRHLSWKVALGCMEYGVCMLGVLQTFEPANGSECYGVLQLEAHEEWEEEIDDIVAQFEAEYGRRPVYSICFY